MSQEYNKVKEFWKAFFACCALLFLYAIFFVTCCEGVELPLGSKGSIRAIYEGSPSIICWRVFRPSHPNCECFFLLPDERFSITFDELGQWEVQAVARWGHEDLSGGVVYIDSHSQFYKITPSTTVIFMDGFESGSLTSWSGVQ